MDPDLPFKSLALFRAPTRLKRSDVVLVDHPEYGPIVRKISAISVNGRVGLRGISRSGNSARKLGNVDRDRVIGKLAMRLKWVRYLPYFGATPPAKTIACEPDLTESDAHEPEEVGVVEDCAAEATA